MHDRDRLLRQLGARIEFGDRRIVPGLDFTEEDSGERRAVDNQGAGLDTSDVDDRHDAAHHHRELRDAALLQIGAGQRRVRSAERDGAGIDLLDAAARTDRLVVQADAGGLFIGVRPFRVDRIRESRARPRNIGNRDCADGGNRTRGHQCSEQLHGSLLLLQPLALLCTNDGFAPAVAWP
jgi:hypothetical protein